MRGKEPGGSSAFGRRHGAAGIQARTAQMDRSFQIVGKPACSWREPHPRRLAGAHCHTSHGATAMPRLRRQHTPLVLRSSKHRCAATPTHAGTSEVWKIAPDRRKSVRFAPSVTACFRRLGNNGKDRDKDRNSRWFFKGICRDSMAIRPKSFTQGTSSFQITPTPALINPQFIQKTAAIKSIDRK